MRISNPKTSFLKAIRIPFLAFMLSLLSFSMLLAQNPVKRGRGKNAKQATQVNNTVKTTKGKVKGKQRQHARYQGDRETDRY